MVNADCARCSSPYWLAGAESRFCSCWVPCGYPHCAGLVKRIPPDAPHAIVGDERTVGGYRKCERCGRYEDDYIHFPFTRRNS